MTEHPVEMHGEYTTNFSNLVARELRPPQFWDDRRVAVLGRQIAVWAENFGVPFVVLKQVVKPFRPLPDTDKVRSRRGCLIAQKLK